MDVLLVSAAFFAAARAFVNSGGDTFAAAIELETVRDRGGVSFSEILVAGFLTGGVPPIGLKKANKLF